ncbi:MAG: peptidase U62 [bacterium]|nr:peptidase U62 [bacterium]
MIHLLRVAAAATVSCLLLVPNITAASDQANVDAHPVLGMLADELNYSFERLVSPDGLKPYYLAYTATDIQTASVSATLGAVTATTENHRRWLDVDVRVGDYTLDNTHKIRGRGRSFGGRSAGVALLSIEDDADAVRHSVWLATDSAFKAAVKRYAAVQTNVKVKVEEEDKSDDFSREEPGVYREAPANLAVDTEAWAARLRKLSTIARSYPLIYSSDVTVAATTETRLMVTSEGSRLQTAARRWRLHVSASTKAEDGMELSKSHIYNGVVGADGHSLEGLPDDDALAAQCREVIEQVLALREAPLVEPYTGPAILQNRASGVFFHEIFGHRIEGHRQKDVEEGQTFTKKIDQPVLPDFLSVHDNPTLARFGETDLRGYYKYDDEGVASCNVTLVEDGILRTFLLSRSPVKGFPKSNGHGRRQPGRQVVARQGNLMVSSKKEVPADTLEALLIEECKKQDKPYGLLFEDITGGFTGTRRRGPQSFKVLPVVVYRIYADGRKELVRGVDIVGTPLSCFEKIVCTGDDPDVFNGTCGAESGWVPVSAVSPSILVSSIEIEKRERAQSRPPILSPPVADAQ